MINKKAFTLLELLVATTIFMVGFVAVYSLFLAGSKYRKDADSQTLVSMAASSVIAEMKIMAGYETNPSSVTPKNYNGDGDGENTDDDEEFDFYRHPEMSRILYRVENCTDIWSKDNVKNPRTIRFELLLIDIGEGEANMSYKTLDSRFRIEKDKEKYESLFTPEQFDIIKNMSKGDPEAVKIFLERRGVLYRQIVVITRKLM